MANAQPVRQEVRPVTEDASTESLIAELGLALRESGLAPMAAVLGGSHARGDAVWVSRSGRRLCLSDVDLHLVARTPEHAGELRRVLAGARAGIERRLAGAGLRAPLEIGVHDSGDWERLPPRPSTLELRESGRVLLGDPEAVHRLPAHAPGDVPAEERLLLVENRAFELLAARWDAAGDEPELDALRACHAQYKVALDLAAIERLERGAWEPRPQERVRAARAARTGSADREGAASVWGAALDWRSLPDRPASDRDADWSRIAVLWAECWRRLAAPGLDRGDVRGIARAAARRARWRRRLHLAVRPGMPGALAPPLVDRLARAAAGTPQHRLNASAGAFLTVLALERDATGPERRSDLGATLEELGVVRAGLDDATTARALLRAWRRWVMGEARGADRP